MKERTKLPFTRQVDIVNLIKFIIITKNELENLNIKIKHPGLDGFTGEFYHLKHN